MTTFYKKNYLELSAPWSQYKTHALFIEIIRSTLSLECTNNFFSLGNKRTSFIMVCFKSGVDISLKIRKRSYILAKFQ